MTDKIVPLTKDELQKMLDNSPFIAFLGLMVTETDPANEQITMTCAMRPEFERGKGTGQWHGGPLAAIIDTVGDYALIMALRRGLPTINFRVDYLQARHQDRAWSSPPRCGAPARAWAWSMSMCSTSRRPCWRWAVRPIRRCPHKATGVRSDSIERGRGERRRPR